MSQDVYIRVTCQSHIWTYQGSHITPTAHAPHIIEPPPAWTVPCWHTGSMDSWSCLHTRTRPSAWYNWNRDSSDQETCFQSSTVQCCRWAQAKCKALCHTVSKDTRVGLRLQKPISMMFRWMVLTLTLVDGPALKSAAICRRVAPLLYWTILFNYHSCRIFFLPQQCWRFDVLSDSWYSRCTGEMVIWENPQHIATSETLCPSLMRWCLNSLKLW